MAPADPPFKFSKRTAASEKHLTTRPFANTLESSSALFIRQTTEGRGSMHPQDRIEALKSAPPNGWIAFSEDEQRVVAQGLSYDEVVELAEKNGVTEPVVVKVPENWDDRVLSA